MSFIAQEAARVSKASIVDQDQDDEDAKEGEEL